MVDIGLDSPAKNSFKGGNKASSVSSGSVKSKNSKRSRNFSRESRLNLGKTVEVNDLDKSQASRIQIPKEINSRAALVTHDSGTSGAQV